MSHKNLIIGGAGFIGRQIARRLLERGTAVSIVDILLINILDTFLLLNWLPQVSLADGLHRMVAWARTGS